MQMHCLNNEMDEAIKLGKSAPYYDDEQGFTNTLLKPYFLLEMSKMFFLDCDMPSSLSCADAAINVVESDEKGPVGLFSCAYGLKGISSLYLGKFQDAEDYLQISTRWCQTIEERLDPLFADAEVKTKQLIALSNVAYYHWFRYGPVLKSKGQVRKHGTDVLIDEDEIFNAASEAKMYLEEALNEAVGEEHGELERRLEVPAFCAAYATVLCNCAEIDRYQGRKVEEKERLLSALKALSITNDFTHSNSNDQCTYNTSCAPVLGRILHRLGVRALEDENAVVAEGLFKSSIDSFESPSLRWNPRHQFHRALVMQDYGSLQTRWEKRERTGESMINEANRIMDTLPFSVMTERSRDSPESIASVTTGPTVKLSHFVQIPE